MEYIIQVLQRLNPNQIVFLTDQKKYSAQEMLEELKNNSQIGQLYHNEAVMLAMGILSSKAVHGFPVSSKDPADIKQTVEVIKIQEKEIKSEPVKLGWPEELKEVQSCLDTVSFFIQSGLRRHLTYEERDQRDKAISRVEKLAEKLGFTLKIATYKDTVSVVTYQGNEYHVK